MLEAQERLEREASAGDLQALLRLARDKVRCGDLSPRMIPGGKTIGTDQVEIAPFVMDATPVTNRLWHEVMETELPKDADPEEPKVYVSWYDAIRFCNWRSERDGLRPAYRLRGESEEAGRYQFREIAWDRDADGWHLPTEAQWEHACRAGTTGDRYGELDEIAWYAANSGGKLHPVARKKPNDWGLYDMLGLAWEWTWDEYHSPMHKRPDARYPFQAAPTSSALDASGNVSDHEPHQGTTEGVSCHESRRTQESSGNTEDRDPFDTAAPAVSLGAVASSAQMPRLASASTATQARAAATSGCAAPGEAEAEEGPEDPFDQSARGASYGAVASSTSQPTFGRAIAATSLRCSPATTAGCDAPEDEEGSEDPFSDAAPSASDGAVASSTSRPSFGREIATTSIHRAPTASADSDAPGGDLDPFVPVPIPEVSQEGVGTSTSTTQRHGIVAGLDEGACTQDRVSAAPEGDQFPFDEAPRSGGAHTSSVQPEVPSEGSIYRSRSSTGSEESAVDPSAEVEVRVPFDQEAPFASDGAVASTTTRPAFGRAIATTSFRRSPSAATVFAVPEGGDEEGHDVPFDQRSPSSEALPSRSPSSARGQGSSPASGSGTRQRSRSTTTDSDAPGGEPAPFGVSLEGVPSGSSSEERARSQSSTSTRSCGSRDGLLYGPPPDVSSPSEAPGGSADPFDQSVSAPTASSGAVASSTSRPSFGRAIATSSIRRSPSSTTGSAVPGGEAGPVDPFGESDRLVLHEEGASSRPALSRTHQSDSTALSAAATPTTGSAVPEEGEEGADRDPFERSREDGRSSSVSVAATRMASRRASELETGAIQSSTPTDLGGQTLSAALEVEADPFDRQKATTTDAATAPCLEEPDGERAHSRRRPLVPESTSIRRMATTTGSDAPKGDDEEGPEDPFDHVAPDASDGAVASSSTRPEFGRAFAHVYTSIHRTPTTTSGCAVPEEANTDDPFGAAFEDRTLAFGASDFEPVNPIRASAGYAYQARGAPVPWAFVVSLVKERRQTCGTRPVRVCQRG